MAKADVVTLSVEPEPLGECPTSSDKEVGAVGSPEPVVSKDVLPE